MVFVTRHILREPPFDWKGPAGEGQPGIQLTAARAQAQYPRMTIHPSEFDFRAARLRLEGKAKSGAPKVTTIEVAVDRVTDGAHVALGGCLFSRTPLALVRALLRRRPRGL